MARASDAQDVEIPIEVMSYVEVPLDLPIGIFWHKTNMDRDQKRSVEKHGLQRFIGGRASVFTDGFAQDKNEWIWGLTEEGCSFTDPVTGQLIVIDKPYGYNGIKKCKPGQKTYYIGIDWKCMPGAKVPRFITILQTTVSCSGATYMRNITYVLER